MLYCVLLYATFLRNRLSSVFRADGRWTQLFIQNTGNHLKGYTVSQFRRQGSKNHIHNKITANGLTILWSKYLHWFSVFNFCPKSTILPSFIWVENLTYLSHRIRFQVHIKCKVLRRCLVPVKVVFNERSGIHTEIYSYINSGQQSSNSTE